MLCHLYGRLPYRSEYLGYSDFNVWVDVWVDNEMDIIMIKTKEVDKIRIKNKIKR